MIIIFLIFENKKVKMFLVWTLGSENFGKLHGRLRKCSRPESLPATPSA